MTDWVIADDQELQASCQPDARANEEHRSGVVAGTSGLLAAQTLVDEHAPKGRTAQPFLPAAVTS